LKINGSGIDAILPRRLQEDWAKDAGECPMVLMSLRVDFGPMD